MPLLVPAICSGPWGQNTKKQLKFAMITELTDAFAVSLHWHSHMSLHIRSNRFLILDIISSFLSVYGFWFVDLIPTADRGRPHFDKHNFVCVHHLYFSFPEVFNHLMPIDLLFLVDTGFDTCTSPGFGHFYFLHEYETSTVQK